MGDAQVRLCWCVLAYLFSSQTFTSALAVVTRSAPSFEAVDAEHAREGRVLHVIAEKDNSTIASFSEEPLVPLGIRISRAFHALAALFPASWTAVGRPDARAMPPQASIFLILFLIVFGLSWDDDEGISKNVANQLHGHTASRADPASTVETLVGPAPDGTGTCLASVATASVGETTTACAAVPKSSEALAADAELPQQLQAEVVVPA
eukprot:TRINITY_DN23059_c0_g1_i2.p1 TRINITY_DN23059_c0_g1~~TRINITY_DN23059_c0_g1_i2.p1  ORF type:complete len:208 (-),score=22.41 TRINITY_DN23059_c0_g1_i2:104-727(-)